jgi:hypothetical protein
METGARERTPEAPLPVAAPERAAPLPPGPARVLALQRTAGNRAVAALLSRAPADDTGDLHADIYGDSDPHAAAPYVPLKTALAGAEFDWSAVHSPSEQVVRDWLTFFNLREPFNTLFPAPGECDFNLDRTTTTAVTDLFMHESGRGAHLAFDRPMVANAVTARLNALLVWHDRRMGTRTPITGPIEPGVPDPNDRPPGSVPALPGLPPGLALPPSQPGRPDPARRERTHSPFSITVQGNFTRHTSGPPDPLATQLTFQGTAKLHEDGAAGIELSLQGGATFALRGFGSAARISDVTITDAPSVIGVSNAQVAAQAAWVAPLFGDILQLSAFAQIAGGVNWNQVPEETPTPLPGGRRTLMPPTPPSPAAQIAAGAQAGWALPGSDGDLLLFVQGQGSATASPDGSGLDGQVSFGIQGNF